MSLILENVRFVGPDAKCPFFDGLSLAIADNSRIGVLGTNKPGNSALLRLICGTRLPEDGFVRRDIRVSWPIPLSTFLVPAHSIARNVRFIARLYGIDDESFPRRVAESVDLGEFVNTPLAKCPKFVKPRLAFALGMGIDFDTYLFDGSLVPVDKPFREKAAALLAERTAGRGVIVATGAPAEVEQNCESVYVLEQGRATYFAETSEGVEHFKRLLAMEGKRGEVGTLRREADENDDEGLSDVDIIGAAVATALE